MKKLFIFSIVFLAGAQAFAEEIAKEGGSENSGLIAIAAGVAIALGALGGAIGQGLIGSSAMQGIARNPEATQKMFVPMIIGLALVESLVIYALLIAFQLVGKV